jgi:hypothetical protein
MILFQVVSDHAATSAVGLRSSFIGNPLVNLYYQVAPAFERKTLRGKAYPFGQGTIIAIVSAAARLAGKKRRVQLAGGQDLHPG